MPAGEAAGWLLAMCAVYLSGSVQTVCNRFAGLRAHYGIEWRMLDTGTQLVPDPGSTAWAVSTLLKAEEVTQSPSGPLPGCPSQTNRSGGSLAPIVTALVNVIPP
jgi:hypothetical protein